MPTFFCEGELGLTALMLEVKLNLTEVDGISDVVNELLWFRFYFLFAILMHDLF